MSKPDLKELLLSKKILLYVPILLIFLYALFIRLIYFEQIGKDIYAYEKAIGDLIDGVNPYIWTVESFSNPDDPGNHGFAYLPGMLYIYFPFQMIHLLTNVPFQYLWKMPVLIADLFVGVLLIKILKEENYLMLLISLLLWFINPYIFLKGNYVYIDPIPVFLMFLSLYLVKKEPVLSGASYALSIGVKTFPLVILPVMLFSTSDKKRFVASAALVGLLISLPFMTNINDFLTYLNGAVLIHSQRFIQGRPFLFYISYFYKIEFFQIIPFKIYTFLAMFGGWALTSALIFLKKVKNEYILSLLSFMVFYTFTPVLNRTYLLWFIPVLSVALFRIYKKRYRFMYFVLTLCFWIFYYYYLIDWKDGFHIWRPL
jgi:hypothetical protein